MQNIEVLKLSPADWEAYRDLRLEALHNDPQAFASTYQDNLKKPDSYWQDRLQNADGQKNWLLFARENGKLVGMIGAYVSDDKKVAEIIAVYVTSEARGRGISKELMSKIMQDIEKNESIKKVKLTVNVNQASAVALYKGFGFEIVGLKNGVLGDGKSYDEYFMEKEIV